MAFIDTLKRIKLSKIVGALEAAPAKLDAAATTVGHAVGTVDTAVAKASAAVEAEAKKVGQSFAAGAQPEAQNTIVFAMLGLVAVLLLMRK